MIYCKATVVTRNGRPTFVYTIRSTYKRSKRRFRICNERADQLRLRILKAFRAMPCAFTSGELYRMSLRMSAGNRGMIRTIINQAHASAAIRILRRGNKRRPAIYRRNFA